jgi:multidrug efflux system outer membrane protein
MLKRFLSALAVSAALAAAPVQAQTAGWWAPLGDPALEQLIAQGLGANLDLAQAAARLERSRALLQGADANFAPGGGVFAKASAVRRGGEQAERGLDFSWELDLFGRLKAQSGAAGERVRASEAQLAGAQLAVSTEIAHVYFELQGAREQLALAHGVAENRRRTVTLVEARLRHGAAAPIDDERARAELEAALAQLPEHEAAAQAATHRLAVLTGQSPAGFAAPQAPAASAPATPIALPQETVWLPRRPDVQAMEAQLRARSLDVAAVRAEFYPRLTLSGVLSFVSGSAAAVGTGGFSWLAAPSLLAPLFDRPRIEARLAAARADEKEALAAYRQRVLLAVEEVQTAVARYGASQRQLENLQRRAQHATRAEQLARIRFEAGAADMLELLEAQRSAQQATAQLAQGLTRHRQALIAVLKGLGGA